MSYHILTAYLSGVFVLWFTGRAMNSRTEKWEWSLILPWPLTFLVMLVIKVREP